MTYREANYAISDFHDKTSLGKIKLSKLIEDGIFSPPFAFKNAGQTSLRVFDRAKFLEEYDKFKEIKVAIRMATPTD